MAIGLPRWISFCAVAVVSTVLSSATAQEWTRFRGPNGSGVSDAKTIPVKWADSDINWKAKLPGEGISSPVVWKDNIFVSAAEADQGRRHLLCLDAKTGQELWRQTEAFRVYKKHKVNSFATSTPAVDDQRVYHVWQSAEGSVLLAFTHDGTPAWRFALDGFSEGHGGGVSPIVWDGLVVVACDQQGPSYLVAVDRHTGELRWKTPRKSKRAGYSTPCVYQVAGRPAELIFTEWQHGITGLDPLNGKVRWEIDCFGKETERAIASPIIAGDVIFGTCGFVTSDKHCVAVRPGESGGQTEVKELFRVEKTSPHLPTPLAYNGRLFLWTEKGIVSSVKLDTGDVVTTKRIGGNFSASPVCIDGKLYGVSDDGEVIVLRADDDLEELARNSLDEPSRATPAVSGGRLFMRTMSQLLSIGGPR
ncbi:MAG: PQQ-binding-like beta-propeller repeat protein [Planctomycetaceae bacterium]|nr:PQQ-binding-like beta-propeller repeat protein [Planctomycetaceae bacterium]